MSPRVLVAYATNCGSTKEVAETVAEELTQTGLPAEVVLAHMVRDISAYSLVVLGAPLYMFRWHHDGHQFLSRHRKGLERLRLAIFALGPIEDKPEQWLGAREQLDKELKRYTWLNPVAKEIFGGRFDPAALRFPYTLIPAMNMIPPTDLRDWDRIRAWSRSLAGQTELH